MKKLQNQIRVSFAAILVLLGLLLLVTKLKDVRPENEEANEVENKLAPYDYFEQVRNYPDFVLDKRAFDKAVAEGYADMQKQLKTNPFSSTWLQEGPSNIGGRIQCLAVHPTNPNIMYAGTAFGGVYKTINGGVSWLPVFDSTTFLSIGCITIDKSNPNTIYVGTGDKSMAGSSFTGNGIYKSTNAGVTWNQIGLEQTGVVAKITIHPTNPSILFAATMGFLMRRDNNKGLYKSVDGGTTWSNVLFVDNETGAMDVIMDYANPLVMYATTMRRIRTNQESIVYGNTTRIYKSINGGDNWLELTNGLPPKPWCKVNIEMHPNQSNIIFASVVNQDLQLGGVYKSTNSGSSWTAINTSSIDTNALGGFGWYFGDVRINPYNVNQLFIQGVDLWKTSDNGNTWVYGAPQWYQYIVHADKHDMHFVSATEYFICTDGGIYHTSDDGVNWEMLSNFPITQFYHVKVSPWESGVYYGGAQDQGTSKGNASTISSWQRVLGGDGFRVDFSATNPDLIWASTQNGKIYYSTENGINFQSATDGVGTDDRKNWDSPFLLSKYSSNAYLGTQYVYKTTDVSFPYFNQVSPDLTDGNIYGAQFHNMSVIHENEVNKNYVYAATSDGNVWRSTNEGADWDSITHNLPNRYVTAMASSFINQNLIYVTHSGYKYNEYIPHIHRSKDNGNTWEDISSNLPSFAINDVLTFSKNDSIIAVATDGGVYITTDAGTQWVRMGTNMPVFPVYDLEYDSINYKIIAGTFARSMMSYDVTDLLKRDPDPQGLIENTFKAQMKVYPVPMVTSVNVELPAQYKYERISVVNISGQRMFATNIVNQTQTIQTGDWNNGIYFLLVYVEGMKTPIVKKIQK